MSERKIEAAKRRDYRNGGEGYDNEIPKHRKKSKKVKKPYVILWKLNPTSHAFSFWPKGWQVYKRFDTKYKRDQAFNHILSTKNGYESIEYMRKNYD